MILQVAILLLYASFLIEFLLWPVSSEASTHELLKKWKKNLKINNFIYILIFIYNVGFTLTPLILSIYFLVNNKRFDSNQLILAGIVLAWIGRLLSIKGAYILHTNKGRRLITISLFKWSRNPISLGLYITFLGLVMVYPYIPMIVGWFIFLTGINFKIGIEERSLRDKYGEVYINYQKSTPKYFGL